MDDYSPLIERAFSLDVREESYFVEEIEGEMPPFLRGTYYLNGPARFARGGFRYRHWLDGDGMVCALRFAGNRARFTNRFVRSAKFVAEEEAGRPLFRAFGTAFANDRLKRGLMLESPVNVSVYPYRGRLLAFGEQGLPWELDPVTLDTRGVFNFNCALNEVSPFAAHPRFDAATGEMFNFGIAFSATAPGLNVYRFDGEGRLRYRRRIALDYACSTHDFSLSRQYLIFYLSPYLLRMDALLRGESLMDALSWEPERGSRLLIVSRETGEQVAAIPVGGGYCLHTINSFEQGGRLIVDVIEFERPVYDQYQIVPNLFTEVAAGRPVRFVIDVARRELIGMREIDYRRAPDFPAVAPSRAERPYRDCWMLGISAAGRRGRKFFDQLVHCDWSEAAARDVYQASQGCYLGGEPIFIGDPRDGQAGVVICQMFDAARLRSAFVVFDAFQVDCGPLATIHLREPIPLGFHASFQYAAS
jgi:all-trans-8'-apo-beta-carotenal 15,15'-oxygenase